MPENPHLSNCQGEKINAYQSHTNKLDGYLDFHQTPPHPQSSIIDFMATRHFHSIISQKASAWKESGYLHETYPAISDILEYQLINDTSHLRWLRAAQIEALTVYWYLRLVDDSPHILDLYKKSYNEKSDFRQALGIDTPELKDFMLDHSQEALFEKIKTDLDFSKTHKLEILLLDYPSYILALTMGSGKTALIAAIIATAFAMAMEYETLDEDDESPFMKNALVFAPGKTILGALRLRRNHPRP